VNAQKPRPGKSDNSIHEEPVYFNTKGLAAYIHRSEGAIRNLVMRRAIPFRKVRGRLLYIKIEIDRWISTSEGATLEEILSE
jgi:hypothetical protein